MNADFKSGITNRRPEMKTLLTYAFTTLSILSLAGVASVTSSTNADAARRRGGNPERQAEIDKNWEANRESNERGHESFDPTPIGSVRR